MIAVLAPEPVDWLAPLCDALAASGQTIRVFAPWAIAVDAPAFLPARMRPFWERRVWRASEARGRLAWWIGDAALRAWSGATVDRVMRARVWRRQAAEVLAARWLPTGATWVVAPSLGARRVLALAQSRGAKTALVEDFPSLRELHADLDAAAMRWPESRFLSRYRAPAAWIAEQEAERVLADALIVRSAFAERARRHPRVVGLRESRGEAPVRGVVQAPLRVLLAGPAAARNGTNELLQAIAGRTDVEVLVQPGEGTEPRNLLQRSNIRVATNAERTALDGVDRVVAPALCEGHFPQLGIAAARGIPIVATDRAAGFTNATLIPVGDVAALANALRVDAPVVATTASSAPSLWDALNAPPASATPRRARLPIV